MTDFETRDRHNNHY